MAAGRKYPRELRERALRMVVEARAEDEPPVMRALSPADALCYLDACEPGYRPLAETLIGAGLRIGEAVALEWRDVDLEALSIAVRRTVKRGGVGLPKGDRPRTVMIDSEIAAALHAHRKTTQRVSGLVFASRAGTYVDRNHIRQRGHMRALRAAGLDTSIRLHDLRHTAASLWLAAGESILLRQGAARPR